MLMFTFINVTVLQLFINFDTWNVSGFIDFFKINCSDSRTPKNKCSNIRSLHSEATMSKARVFMPDGFSLSCKENWEFGLDGTGLKLNENRKKLKILCEKLCVKRYYIKEMPRNSKVEIQYREFVLGWEVGFCGFINSALKPEQSFFSLPEYIANYELPLWNLSEVPDPRKEKEKNWVCH